MHNQDAGFTLFEVVLVIILISILSAMAIPRIQNRLEISRQFQAKLDIKLIQNAVNSFYFDNGSYPEPRKGIMLLVEKDYLNGKDIIDPWKNQYVYQLVLADGITFQIISLGKDNKLGGEKFNQDIICNYP